MRPAGVIGTVVPPGAKMIGKEARRHRKPGDRWARNRRGGRPREWYRRQRIGSLCCRVDAFACAEWRLRRFIHDVGVGIHIVVGESADIGGTFPLQVIDESTEHTSIIGFAAGIDPACAIDGAVGIFGTDRLVGGEVLAGIAGAEGLPVVAGGIGDVAVHRWFRPGTCTSRSSRSRLQYRFHLLVARYRPG